tara:strand:- start:1750 stop:2463 length:714 start_codon:yes stop_codon:yes gene_type:complete
MNKSIKYKFFNNKNGKSKGIYSSLNCGLKSQDNFKNIKKNIEIAKKSISKKEKILIIPNQSHSNKCLIVRKNKFNYNCDSIVTRGDKFILGITTADCLPIILIDYLDGVIGICHAGWKGIKRGIIENTVNKMIKIGSKRSNLSAFIGPCIRKYSYEVSIEFVNGMNLNAMDFYTKKNDKYFFDLPKLAKFKLNSLGVFKIVDSKIDTYKNKNYFSYRRSAYQRLKDYGRNISLVTIN